MIELAVTGGRAIRDVDKNPWPKWPVWDDNEERGLQEVLHSGVWSYNGPKEREFNEAFARFIGSKYALCAANGTVTLQLALEACGVGLGDEVIVPGLTWQATAASVLDLNAVPILVDVCEDTWCIDPETIAKALTKRTKAIIPVHLYGCFADMDAIMALAKKHDLYVIEDCAHKHGAIWHGKKAGSIGDVGSFSFQLSKLMTAGEGGALTTSRAEVFERLDALRNCGRRPELDRGPDHDKGTGVYGEEGNFMQSGNYRITDFQASLLLESLKRLPEQNRHRDNNAQKLNASLAELPGVAPMRRDAREELAAYYNFSFRYFEERFKGLPVTRFRDALAAELGCSVESSYEPLDDCELYKPHTKPWRYKIDENHWQAVDPERFSLPVCHRIHEKESVCLHFTTITGPAEDMELIAAAITKIYNYAEELQ
jgi:L-glutamine:2-deoxy-scyllo-inosose/3-amino-2,3-dideoxy-scyllo-inosose aminotransferase